MQVKELYQQYCKEGFDENGVLNYFEPVVPEHFNFGYDVVDAIAALEPQRRAMIWCNEAGKERTFTFQEMSEYSNRAANLFLKYGVKKGDRVMLILKRHYQFWFAITALHKIGAIVIPATHLLTEKDIQYRFESAEVSAIVCTSDGQETAFVDAVCQEYHGLTAKFVVNATREGWIDFDSELEQMPATLERVDTRWDDPMLLYFTSGTTGYPKMVYHDFSYPIGHIITAKYWHNVDPDGLHLTVSDTGWGKAVWGKLYGQWFCGTAVFVYDFNKFVAADLLRMIGKYHITSFCAPPTIYRFMIKEDGLENYDLSSLKYATTAGEALNAEVFNRFYEVTGLKLMEAFGQTETTVLMANLVGSTPNPGSMGRPSPLYHVEIVDEDLNPVPNGVVGEIVINTSKGKPVGMFQGYYRHPEMTEAAWNHNYYHTGDTAWRDEEGYIWYVGRTDDVIKASGYRIGPFEIESVLIKHPAVVECAVTGAPDPVRGVVVKATVVLTKNYKPSPELTKELQDYVKHQTAPYKYPRIIEYVDELPKTISGKIRRVEIRERDRH